MTGTTTSVQTVKFEVIEFDRRIKRMVEDAGGKFVLEDEWLLELPPEWSARPLEVRSISGTDSDGFLWGDEIWSDDLGLYDGKDRLRAEIIAFMDDNEVITSLELSFCTRYTTKLEGGWSDDFRYTVIEDWKVTTEESMDNDGLDCLRFFADKVVIHEGTHFSCPAHYRGGPNLQVMSAENSTLREAEKWLEERYPDWEHPAAYWDD